MDWCPGQQRDFNNASQKFSTAAGDLSHDAVQSSVQDMFPSVVYKWVRVRIWSFIGNNLSRTIHNDNTMISLCLIVKKTFIMENGMILNFSPPYRSWWKAITATWGQTLMVKPNLKLRNYKCQVKYRLDRVKNNIKDEFLCFNSGSCWNWNEFGYCQYWCHFWDQHGNVLSVSFYFIRIGYKRSFLRLVRDIECYFIQTLFKKMFHDTIEEPFLAVQSIKNH